MHIRNPKDMKHVKPKCFSEILSESTEEVKVTVPPIDEDTTEDITPPVEVTEETDDTTVSEESDSNVEDTTEETEEEEEEIHDSDSSDSSDEE